MTAILEALASGPLTVVQIATAVGKSASRVRELVKPLVASGAVIASVDRPVAYALPAIAKAKRRNAGPDAGRGRPGQRIQNPQNTIDRKAEIATELGGSFAYDRTVRAYTLMCGGRTATITPAQLSELSYADFEGVCRGTRAV